MGAFAVSYSAEIKLLHCQARTVSLRMPLFTFLENNNAPIFILASNSEIFYTFVIVDKPLNASMKDFTQA